MRFLLAGGTGQIGTVLTRALKANGHEVTNLSRSYPAWAAASAELVERRRG